MTVLELVRTGEDDAEVMIEVEFRSLGILSDVLGYFLNTSCSTSNLSITESLFHRLRENEQSMT